MRVFISVDMEGVAGIVHRDQTGREGKDYEQARKLMTNEANAAIKGAVQAGAKEILVNDAHGTMRNIDSELLRSEARLISGSPKKLGMMEGIDKNHDAALFIGYHAKAGAEGVLNHTYNSKVLSSLLLNGQEIGEFGLNALVAGAYGVPVVFVSGCDLLIKEAQELIPNIHYAQVKRSINRVTAESVHPTVSCSLIENGVQQALQNVSALAPYLQQSDEYHFEIRFLNTLFADAAETLPIVKRTAPLSVQFTTDDIVDGYLMVRGLLMMANNFAK